ncbi:MAG: PDZ domain-containing protein, partial [bacterium]
MNRYLTLQLVALMCLSAFFGFKAAQVAAASDFPRTLAALPGMSSVMAAPATAETDIKEFESILEMLNTESLKPVDDSKKLLYGAIEGSVAALGDPYSRYIPPVDNPALEEEISGFYGGIGVLIEVKDSHTIATTVFKGGPADKAGMAPGDVIVKVNGDDVTELYVTAIVEKIKGPIDSPVTITVFRPS